MFNTVTIENISVIIREAINKMTDIVILLYAVNELLKVDITILLNIIWKNWLITVEDGKILVQSTSIKRSPFIKRSLGKVPKISSRKYYQSNLYWTVTSIERTPSPFLQSQSNCTCIKRSSQMFPIWWKPFLTNFRVTDSSEIKDNFCPI